MSTAFYLLWLIIQKKMISRSKSNWIFIALLLVSIDRKKFIKNDEIKKTYGLWFLIVVIYMNMSPEPGDKLR